LRSSKRSSRPSSYELLSEIDDPGQSNGRHALEKMLESGLLIADPPRAEWERGGRVRYSVNGELVSLLYLQLGQALRIL
ncbi:hypothetical protein, partial [Microbacterium sp. NPDC077184]|uniref:hypothetical protein n=1 Tax=Microbacterium sp. NPDC077184 TaxID=3154764 RepID=UPI0034177CDC